MIIYFSATGNCKYVADRIAHALSDRIVSITECMKNREFEFEIEKDEKIGIISPTYSWGLPSIVNEFLEKMRLNVKKETYIYFIATYGTTPGQTDYFTKRCLEKNGLKLAASFSVKMPDTWTPTYDLSNKEKVAKINEAAETQIDCIINNLNKSSPGDFMKDKVPVFAAKAFYSLEYDSMRKTKNFKVADSCIGCGLCARNCPVSAIQIQDKKPVWVKEKCVMCLSCLHHCLKFAIQYGKNTIKHGQYQHSKF